jgi:hypothetical protein
MEDELENEEDCGCSGSPPQDENQLKSRREFVSTVLKTGAAFSLAGVMLVGTSEKAFAFDFGQCMFDCGQQYERDLNGCRRMRNVPARVACWGAAELSAAGCRAGCAASQASAWAAAAAAWIAAHPGATIGAIVVIVGIVCIVVLVGPALVLAPAAAAAIL